MLESCKFNIRWKSTRTSCSTYWSTVHTFTFEGIQDMLMKVGEFRGQRWDAKLVVFEEIKQSHVEVY